MQTWHYRPFFGLELLQGCGKPKFHYADFATLSWTQVMKSSDTNHVAEFHDLCPRLNVFINLYANLIDYIRDFYVILLYSLTLLCLYYYS